MTYFKIKNEQYLNNINLREIISVSGEKLNLNSETFELINQKEYNKNTNKKINYPNIINNICHNAVYDIENEIIIEKTAEMKFQENKNKKKNELLNKSKNDPDFVFGKEEAKDNYKKIFDDIEKAMTQKELDLIEV